MNISFDDPSPLKQDEKTLKSLLDSNRLNELIEFINSKDLSFFFTTRLDLKRLTIFHKIIFSDNPVLFYSVLQVMNRKVPTDNNFTLKKLLCQTDVEGNTPIHFAAYRGNVPLISELIKQGCDYTVRNNSGLSVMHMAAQGDKPNVLLYFKDKYHLNIEQKDFNGATPLHWACYMSAENSINYLLSWIDNLNVQNSKGQTPLHIAIFSDRINIIKKLLNKGINTSLRDSSDKTVYDIAREDPNLENVFRLLIDYKKTDTKCLPQGKESLLYKSYLFSVLSIICDVLTFFVLIPYMQSSLVSASYLVLAIVFLIIYFYMTTSDPGILISNYYIPWLEIVERKIDINLLCPYCKVTKGGYVKHCHSCGHCVDNFDHHCHWINNCIGEKNSAPFIFFLVVLILNLLANYLIGLRVFLLKNEVFPNDNNSLIVLGIFVVRSIKDILSIFIMVVNLFFIVPVCYVLYTQINNRKERSSRKKLSTDSE